MLKMDIAIVKEILFFHALKYLSSKEIDMWFWYCDTDSLYLDLKAFEKISKEIYHKMNLGKWDIENSHIDQFYILNHKKYAYVVNEKIKFRAGGVVKSHINTDMNFKQFIDTQFSEGVKILSTRSILNSDETISIYDNTIELEKGKPYPDYFYITDIIKFDIIKEQVKGEFYNEIENNLANKALYVETEYGTISESDYDNTHIKGKYNIELLIDTMQELTNVL